MCGILSTRRTRSRKVLSMAKGAEENTSILLPERLTPMTTAESETVLNSEAVQAVVNCRVARLRGIVRDAELPDIAQEIRLAIWRNLPKYDPSRAGLPTFINRVADSAVRVQLRNLRRFKRQMLTYAEELQK